MKRWVFLGLLGLMACKEDKPPPPVEPQDCPGPVESARPGDVSALASGLSSEQAADGREKVLIRYRRNLSSSAARAAESAVARVGGKVTARWERLDAVAARLTPEERLALAADPDVLAIEPDRPVYAFANTRLPPLTSGNVAEYTEGLKQVQADAVWDANGDGVLDANAPIGSAIRVCVIDSGWDDRHPELKAAYVGGKDFVENDEDPRDFDTKTETWGGGHGTHTAATIVAQLSSTGSVNPEEDSNGVVGVAPGVELLVARVLKVSGTGDTSAIISALEWCHQQGAKIASLSLGSPSSSTLEREAFADAFAAGMLPIAASGNSGTGDPATEPGIAYPAAYPSVIAVGAVNTEGVRASFSQIGPQLSLVAPGVDVLSASITQARAYSIVEVGGRKYESGSLEFAAVGDYKGKLVACGLGGSRGACGEAATCDGFVAYVDRGGLDTDGTGLTFARKVDFMRRAGARAVIIGNNVADDGIGKFTLGEAGKWLPSASVSYEDALALKQLDGPEARVSLVGVDYERLSGTSMATPHVAGVAALVWSARPLLTAQQVRDLLQDSAKDLGTEKKDNTYGYGLVQAKDALRLLESRFPATP